MIQEQEVLKTEIIIPAGETLSREECDYLVLKEEVATLARDKFAQGLISYEDYLDILETCDINIDDYLVTIENNLHELGIG
jgi:hypothetical protein